MRLLIPSKKGNGNSNGVVKRPKSGTRRIRRKAQRDEAAFEIEQMIAAREAQQVRNQEKKIGM